LTGAIGISGAIAQINAKTICRNLCMDMCEVPAHCKGGAETRQPCLG
jgi:hypothetical protein